MKVAIHNRGGWNDRAAAYCQENGIQYKLIDCYATDVMHTLRDCTHLFWHFSHNIPKDILMARNVLFAASKAGIMVYPDFNSCWHFDDKVSQKYLLEAIQAPLVPSYAFYDENEAMEWLQRRVSFPIVAKLRRGAGSYNVRLLNNYAQAGSYVNRMFGSGIQPSPGYLADVRTKLKVAGNLRGIINRLKKAPDFFRMVWEGRLFPKEKGYVYFQDFIPDNKEDLRIAITKNHIWGVKRKVRENDFRASGSGMLDYDLSDVNVSTIKMLYETFLQMEVQSVAFDLVKTKRGDYLIVEISYGFLSSLFYKSKGYWNENFEFVERQLYPEDVIIGNFLT